MFHIPIFTASSVHRGWLLTAHRDEHHAWNTQLVPADGKNKDLHLSKDNDAGRKDRDCKKMEVVLGAEMLSQLLAHRLFLPPPRVCPRGEWSRAG